jgi:endonuclease/exonuclease/phosphatase family metal-dependent hydrolase
MNMTIRNTFKIMTYNVGGGRKDFGSEPTGVLQTIQRFSPDILAVQECVNWIDVDGEAHNFSESIAKAGGFGPNHYYGRTLSLREHMQIKKEIMLYALYDDLVDWAQGNALFARGGFSRLGDTSKAGAPRNVPIFQPPVYEGTRDTDPRYAILGRIAQGPSYPFVVNVHMTTLMGERGKAERLIPGKTEEAQSLRYEQAQRVIDLVRPVMDGEAIIVLLGDFNATAEETALADIIEGNGGFVRLKPENEIPTHPKVSQPVDHIYIYPKDRLADYSCWIGNNEIARDASDHLPVVAEVKFK